MGVKIRTHWLESQVAAVASRIYESVKDSWYYGLTCFGGPPVHFKIFHDKYIRKLGWIDEQVYQELFSVAQAFSGPASTKLLYTIHLVHGGFLSAAAMFLLWSIPGALGMYALAMGVFRIGDTLPEAVFALLSGLNAATVGIIALAGVQLADRAITDRISRILLFLGAAAGMLYNALWYFPVLLVAAGLAAVIHDEKWLHKPVMKLAVLLRLVRRREVDDEASADVVALSASEAAHASDRHSRIGDEANHPCASTAIGGEETTSTTAAPDSTETDQAPSPSIHGTEVPAERRLSHSWQASLIVLAAFLISFIIVMVLRGVLQDPPLSYSLFANLYLAGTIIFGGGPVVIPLLREYVVAEGWVSSRDFLIGLAIIQGFPGPNFNFAVYLGTLSALRCGYSSGLGAVLGYLGIFVPGLVIGHSTVGIWSAVRAWRWVKSGLRGVNAAAVGLIYTAVYRLWQIGWIDAGFEQGTSLGNDPWWVVVTATSYVGGYWFGLSPPVAILLGAVMGLVRYGVVSGT